MRALLLPILVSFASLGAGCLGVDDQPLPQETDADLGATGPTAPRLDTIEGEIQAALATPALSFNSGGSYNHPLPSAKGQVHGWILELEWQAETRISESLDLWIRDDAQGNVPPDADDDLPPPGPAFAVKGTSPLRLVLEAKDLDEGTTYSILVRAHSEPAGVAVNQPFSLHTATFVDMPVDHEFTVLGGGHAH